MTKKKTHKQREVRPKWLPPPITQPGPTQIINGKRSLPNVALLVADCVDYERAKLALDHCRSAIDFGEVKLLTHFDVDHPVVHNIPQIKSIEEYSTFMVRDLTDYFTTDFVLVAQWDGFVWQPEMWSNDFLKYDYIGAAWPAEVLFPGAPKHYNVGNGGFSIRSKRLQQFLKDNFNKLVMHRAEDVAICQLNRAYLEEAGFTFAPKEVADRFSWECGPKMDAFGVHARFKLVKA